MAAWLFRLFRTILLIGCLLAGGTASAQAPQLIEVGGWQIYGAVHVYGREPLVPGGAAVRIAPRATPGDAWASGAGVPIPVAIESGMHVTGYFWARAAQPARVVVTIQGGAPGYASFATARIRLGPAWKCYAVSGVAPGDLPAGSQSLAIQLGAASAAVSLGPVALQLGTRDDGAVRRAFAQFRPGQIAEDVRIASDPGVVLAGILRLPNRPGEKRYPVAVLLGGGGPAARGVYPLLEKRLLAEGIATLSYDKRGIGQSTGTFVDTIELMERDAAATVAFLRARAEIDDARIALMGLSQGGVVGPAVAAGDPGIAAVVMLGAPVGEKYWPFLDGMRRTLRANGTPEEAIGRILLATGRFMKAQLPGTAPATLEAARQALVAEFTAGGFTPDRARSMTVFLQDPVLVSMYQVATAEVLARVRVPVLALYGGEDSNVPSSGNLQHAEAALRGNPDATVIEVPRVEHHFKSVEIDASGKLKHVGPAVSDPGVLDLVGRWLVQHLRR